MAAAATAQSAAVHSVVATPPTLSADLAFAASLPAEHFAAFCAAGRELLRSDAPLAEDLTAEPPPMLKKAAKALGADIVIVTNAVRALCHVLVSAAITGRPAEDLLCSIDGVELPAASRQSLESFYADVSAELEQETRKTLGLPFYRGLEWRLQVTLGGRYAPQQAPQPSFLLRLHTSAGEAGGEASGVERRQEHVIQADVTSLRRLTSELSEALAEDTSKHSRRIGRRL